METSAFFISLVLNAILVTTAGFAVWEIRKTRNRLFRKDGYIRHTRAQLEQAREEIHRKETVILREKGKGQWKVQFFVEEQEDGGFFKSKYVIRYRFQLMHNGFPVGPAGTVSEEKYSEVDKEQINRILDGFAKPLLEAGIQVAVRGFAA